jgi:hypothetical protein
MLLIRKSSARRCKRQSPFLTITSSVLVHQLRFFFLDRFVKMTTASLASGTVTWGGRRLTMASSSRVSAGADFSESGWLRAQIRTTQGRMGPHQSSILSSICFCWRILKLGSLRRPVCRKPPQQVIELQLCGLTFTQDRLNDIGGQQGETQDAGRRMTR